MKTFLVYNVTGPEFWPDLFPEYCAGNEQSPVNIDSRDAESSPVTEIEFFGYHENDIPESGQMTLVNNGHTGTFCLLYLSCA